MSASSPVMYPEQDISLEIESIRQDLLLIFMISLPILSWVWLYYALSRGWDPGVNMIPTVVLCGMASAGYFIRERHPTAAARLVVLAAILAAGAIAFAHPSTVTLSLGILAILLANALLAGVEITLTTIVAWCVCVQAGNLAVGRSLVRSPGIELAALYLLTLGAVWLGARPLRTAIRQETAQWHLARDAMVEARSRRAEVYGVMRSLEEAARRIERMNGELMAARREAEAARSLKARFVATVSHELRGPLNMILGYSRLMALSPDTYGKPLPRVYRADVYTIYRNCQHLLTLIDDILDLSQIEADKMPLVKDQIDIESDVVDKVVGIVRPLAERKNLSLVTELHGALPWVLADPVRLRQALLNLLVNAIRFTEAGQITVRTYLTEHCVIVQVQDSGPGIAKEDIPKLFGEFTQVLRPAAEAEGSGLGLAISKHLVELHRGEIWVESQPGHGATFSFSVPLPGAEPVEMGGLVATRASDVPSERPTCLVVHNDPDVVRLLSRHIEGYQVVGAVEPDTVADMIQELHPWGIITARTLASQVEEQIAQTPFDVPLIACDLPHVAGHYGAHHVLGQLTKPLVPDVLHAVMNRAEKPGEMTLLIVDDEPDAVRLIERMLTSLPRPYRILRAYDGHQALQVMREQHPDLVFLDMVMPGLGGREVLAEVSQDPTLDDVGIVIISGRDWITENTSLGRLYSVTCRRDLSAARGINCLHALLSATAPDYLSGARDPEPSEPALAAQPVFVTPHPPPEPAPDEAD